MPEDAGKGTHKPPDWDSLEFKFTATDHMYFEESTTGGEWPGGGLREFGSLMLSPAAAALNYGQSVFEGLKALRGEGGEILLFRPEENARRFRRSASRLEMPPYPLHSFLRAVEDLVRADAAWVPPAGKGSLYIRPVMLGSGAVLGVAPSPSYCFYIFASPVGLYRPGEGRLMIQDSTHRAAPFGTGDLKAAGNYAGTMRAQKIAAARGYKDVIYLDARHDRYVEEVGSSNFFAVLRDGTLVTPRALGSILPGITRDSVMTIARELLGMKVVEKGVDIAEVLSDAAEAFFTGTAAGIQPITVINYKGSDHRVGSGGPGEATAKLHEALTGIQTGRLPDPFGWVPRVEV